MLQENRFVKSVQFTGWSAKTLQVNHTIFSFQPQVQVNHPIPENVKRHAGSSLEDTLLLLDIVKENNMKQQKQKKVEKKQHGNIFSNLMDALK